MSTKLALSMLLRAAVLLLESEEGEDASMQSESASPESEPSTGSGPAPDAAAGEPPGRRRKSTRPMYRPQGPVDEVSARRADEALKQLGLLPVTPKRKK
jgi:hypothetical protein